MKNLWILVFGLQASLPALDAASPFEGDATPVGAGAIDRSVFGRLRALQIESAHLCPDAGFVRRTFLDVIGTLPTAREARDFIEDKNPQKRGELIERLLARD